MAKSVLKNRKTYLLGLLLAVIIVVGLAKLFDVGPFHKEAVVTTASAFNTKGEKQASGGKGGSAAATGQDSQNSSAASDKAASSTATLFTPSGQFISNHHPNLSGSPAPNTIASVCNTTPGAGCKIIFTMGGNTKSLPSHDADANGTAYWSWKLQDIGLTAGTWKVQAVASLNGQTKSASDAMDLVVAP